VALQRRSSGVQTALKWVETALKGRPNGVERAGSPPLHSRPPQTRRCLPPPQGGHSGRFHHQEDAARRESTGLLCDKYVL
jgi:hypothetical protein